MVRLRLLCLGVVTLALAGVAAARAPASLPDLTGTWTITVQDAPCTFGGQATLRKSGEGYVGELTMRQDCPFWEDGPITAIQSSSVSVLGSQISVRSKIVEFATTEWADGYAPDHFALNVQSPDRLFGIQTDRYGTKPAEWKRSETGIS